VNDETGAREDDDVTPDEFAHLFRPDDDPPPAASPEGLVARESAPPASASAAEESWEPLVPLPHADDPALPPHLEDPPLPPPAEDDAPEFVDAQNAEIVEVVEEVASPAPAPDGSRLFRSRGAPERNDAITAIGSLQARRLKTMGRSDEPGQVPIPVGTEGSDDSGFLPPNWNDNAADSAASAEPWLPAASSGEPAPALQVMARPAAPATKAAPAPRRSVRADAAERSNIRSSGSLTALGVYAVTIGVTVILAFGQTMFFGGEPGLITGIGLVVVSIVAAFVVRTRDGLHAIFAPPIAFFVAAMTAGQVDIAATDASNRAVVVFFLLGNNWPWIIGATAAALVIVALRRRVG
jgi:hypothetical protein